MSARRLSRSADEALTAALYDDGCLHPPRTDHVIHVLAALRAEGWQLIDREAVAALLQDRWGLPRQVVLDTLEDER